MTTPRTPSDFRPLSRLVDGTIKQINPFTGTDVWTVPGRANRPLTGFGVEAHPIDPAERGRHCAFCDRRYLETTPEITRVVHVGDHWETFDRVAPNRLEATVADFRVVPNLFEIVSFDYWRANHGYEPNAEQVSALRTYESTAAGREHLSALVATRMRAAGASEADIEHLSAGDLEDHAIGFFAPSHVVVIARRHFISRATRTDQLAGSMTLSTAEHEQYLRLTIQAMHELYRSNPHAQLVAAFQNWLKPAGASFDHLHKQLVAVDELGNDLRAQLERLEHEPDLYERWGVQYAREQGLVIAENDHAVLTAGVGHRHPSLEIWSTAPGRPWELSEAAVRGWSDLLHAAHAATGVLVPTNEEWHHQPPSIDQPMPLRAILKWRINTTAGFEGGTKIYVNTIDPWTLADRVRAALEPLRARGEVNA
ncbi:DUF4921 family protein [Kribbia dieselivorans]|uniref:DUF4921 family protein n=1 Tax=Kribbia dieselivorans TaxID=331526 RepID=UPI000AB5D832|nr:DUF4921 family protein [Kribbia dieselivorans]